MNTIDASNVTINCQTLDFAWWNAEKTERVSPGMAAHIYVQIAGMDRSTQGRVRNWAAFRKRRYTGAGDGWPVRHAISFGLDNFSGIQRGKAQAFAEYLEGRGVQCRVIEIDD